jgi:hypothetical protein
MDLKTAQIFFPPAGVNRPYNERFFCANEPSVSRWIDFAEHARGGYTFRTNSLGMMEDDEVLPTRPDLRILVVSDSHGVGLCDNSESFTHRLEASLLSTRPTRSTEALNASVGGYSFYNYLGVLEEYVKLRPHVFVMGVYGGNDFGPMLQLQRYYHRRPPYRDDAWPLELTRSLVPKHIGTQELLQAQYFRTNPEDIDVSIETADAITMEIERICKANDIVLLVMYIPTPFLTQARFFTDEAKFSLEKTGLTLDHLRVVDRIANNWIQRARGRGVEVLDLRPTFERSNERLFNSQIDCHTNVKAHALMGQLLAERVEGLLRRRSAQ